MVYQEAFEVLQKTADKPVFALAFSHLKNGRHIQIRMAEQKFFLSENAGRVLVSEGPSALADIEFEVQPEGLRALSHHPGDSLSGFGIAVVEQIAAGQMKIHVIGSSWSILSGGYINLILAGGPEFMSFLASKGLHSVQSIISLIKSLKN